jgi:hypothetical protein
LFCFVLFIMLRSSKPWCSMPQSKAVWFCFVCHVEISQTMALHAVLSVSSESS